MDRVDNKEIPSSWDFLFISHSLSLSLSVPVWGQIVKAPS